MTIAVFARRLLSMSAAAALCVPALTANAQTLKPPLSHLSWLVGTWTCSGTVSIDGNDPHAVPLSTFVFSPGPGGGLLVDKEVSGSVRSTGHLYFNGRQWVDDVAATSPHGSSTYTFTGEDVDVGPDHVDLKGSGTSRGIQVGVRLVRKRTGENSFHEASYASAAGAWHQIEDVSCKRK